jgi:transposase
MLAAEKNRLHQGHQRRIIKSIEAVIRVLERQIDDTEGALAKAVEQSDLWRAQNELLQSAPGIGPVNALALMFKLPELGQLDRGKGRGAVCSRQRQAPRKAAHTRRPRRCARLAVHGNGDRHSLQSAHQGLPRTTDRAQ